MKTHPLSSLLLALLGSALLTLPLTAENPNTNDACCDASESPDRVTDDQATHEHHAAPPATADLPDTSLYQLSATWTDQNGKPTQWSDSVGTIRVVALGYASCRDICPRIIADMGRIEKQLTPAERSRVRFTFISVDPENDTPAVLKKLALQHHVDEAQWDFFTGKHEQILELAVALGVHYDARADGNGFSHSYLISVLDAEGRVINKWLDASKTPDDSIAALRSALGISDKAKK